MAANWLSVQMMAILFASVAHYLVRSEQPEVSDASGPYNAHTFLTN
jgi:hypothetical protein